MKIGIINTWSAPWVNKMTGERAGVCGRIQFRVFW